MPKDDGLAEKLSKGGNSKQYNTGLIIVGVVLVILFSMGLSSLFYQYNKNQQNELLLMDLTNQLMTLQTELKTEKLSVTEKLSKIETDVGANSERLQINESRIEGLQQKDLEIDGEIANQRLEYETLSSDAMEQLRELALKDQTLEGRIDDQQERIDNQQEIMNDINTDIDNLQQDLQDISDRVVNIDPNTICPGYTLLEFDNIYKLYFRDFFEFVFPIDPDDPNMRRSRYQGFFMHEFPLIVSGNVLNMFPDRPLYEVESTRQLFEMIHDEFLEYSMSNWDDDNIVKIFLEDITRNEMTTAFQLWRTIPLLFQLDYNEREYNNRWYNPRWHYYYLDVVSLPSIFAPLHFNPSELLTKKYIRHRNHSPEDKLTYDEYWDEIVTNL